MSVETILDGVIRREGAGFVQHPADRGGPTRYGITLATLERWRGGPVSADDVRQLTEGEARQIYRARYVEAPGFLSVTTDDALLTALVDFAVHSGPRAAVLALQRAVSVTADGAINAATRAAVARLAPREVAWRLHMIRIELLCRLAERHPEQRVFWRGWMARVMELVPHGD